MWRPKGRSEATSNGQQPAADAQEVARIAYQLYEQRGRLDGYDMEDWLQAEVLVRRQNPRRRLVCRTDDARRGGPS